MSEAFRYALETSASDLYSMDTEQIMEYHRVLTQAIEYGAIEEDDEIAQAEEALDYFNDELAIRGIEM